MPLFFRNQNISDEEQLKANLASLAGGAAGFAGGTTASIPFDASYQTKLLNQARQLEKDKTLARENWKTLLQIAKGHISLDDLPPNDREFFADQLVKQKKMLDFLIKNPLEAKNALDDLSPKVHVLHPTITASAPMTGIFEKKVQAPISKHLPFVLGGLGLAGAGIGVEKYYENMRNNPLESKK